MSQNGPHSGPPWSGEGSEEPYTEPADPWGDHGAPASASAWGASGGAAAPPEPQWGLSSPAPDSGWVSAPTSAPGWGAPPPSIPQQPVSYHSGPPDDPISGAGPVWGPPPPAPAKRNTPMLALVITLGLLACLGLGATLWLLKARNDKPASTAAPAASTAANPGPAPIGSEDARFYVKKGDCVVNEGTDEEPEMRTTVCTSGTYVVLERYKGKTTGEKDAEGKCAKVTGYTKWYFYDSPLDDLDFVLCLKEHSSL